MQFLQNTSIRQRLTYIIMSVSFISVLLITLTISLFGYRSLRDGIINELDLSAAIVGGQNAAALSFDTYDRVENDLRVFSAKQTVILACLYDYKTLGEEIINRQVGSYISSEYKGPDRLCPMDLKDRTSIDENSITLMRTVNDSQSGEKLGSIFIESTLQDMDHYIQKQTSIALTVSLVTLGISYLLAIGLQRTISRPILSLADTARTVSARKDYSIRAPVIGDAQKEFNNELVILTDAFNDMLSEIGSRELQLKKQNIDLGKARDAAEAANRAKSQFLANISHELRTPLNAIIGFSSILMNQLFGPLGDQKYLEYSRDINDSGAHLLDIINDILDLSKAEAGRLSLNYEEVHVGKAINKCLTILNEKINKNKLTVTTDIPKTLPALVADRLRFIQILLNLISNAVKFTKESGKVHIAVRPHETAGEITHFIISIEDTGIGMAPHDVEKAFQSFGQVDSGLNRKYEGTGLGLPLTKKLVDLHYADIALVSELGKGTTVTLTFPVMPPPEAGYLPEE